ncbi:MAG: hypothetical protein O2782_22770, partial [bacterium]|nr:hypothetical protein [bacterium]
APSVIDPILIVSGDARIARLLAPASTVVQHAASCQLDGFVNDTFTEYANPSVYRPASVCAARLISTMRYSFHAAGDFYLAFTMYTTATAREAIDVYIGDEHVAVAVHPDPDNRLHMFVVASRRRFIGGEAVRLATNATDGPCRIESIVLLPRKPAMERPKLALSAPAVDLEGDVARRLARVTWTSSRPATGFFEWGPEGGRMKRQRIAKPQVNHEAVLNGLREGTKYRYCIALSDRTGVLSVERRGSFTTRSRASRCGSGRASAPLLARRAGATPWPVSVGFPFASGVLSNADSIALRQGDQPLPSQASALARWPDGSVKWALVDFVGDGTQDVQLDYGGDVRAAPAASPIRVRRGRDGIRVDTGVLRVSFPAGRLVLPGCVEVCDADGTWRSVSGQATAAAVRLVDGTGRVYESGPPEALVVETTGPGRVCIRADVVHRAKGGKTLFRSIFRFHLFAGLPLLRCLHTFENDHTDAPFTTLRSLTLRADLAVGGKASARFDDLEEHRVGAGSLRLEQLQDNGWALKRSRRVVDSGHRSTGSVALKGAAGGVAFAARDFWQNYPAAIAADGQGISHDVCPELPGSLYPQEGELEDRLFFWYEGDGGYRIKQGMAKTHEFWFDFAPDATAADATTAGDGFAANVQTPPLYSVGRETFNDSGVLTQLPGKDPSPFPPYERWVEGALQAYIQDRAESRAWGLFNFGDWFGERTYNWGNMEYDTPWCYLQEFLRGGDADFYTLAEEAARHLVDVDTCHHGGALQGNQYLHSVGHVGGYYPEGYRPRSICGSRSSVSHTWVEGLFLHALLSGDVRSREAAEVASANLVGAVLNDYDFTNCRNSGWHLIHLSAAYRATGRRVFLNAAGIIAERVLERQRDTGGWDRLMVPGHCYCDPPRHTGNAGFMVGVLMAGLKRYHEATAQQRVADAIVRAADYCIEHMWVAEASAFRYTCCPESSVGSGADMRILKGVAAAYGFTGNKRFHDVLAAGVRSAMA